MPRKGKKARRPNPPLPEAGVSVTYGYGTVRPTVYTVPADTQITVASSAAMAATPASSTATSSIIPAMWSQRAMQDYMEGNRRLQEIANQWARQAAAHAGEFISKTLAESMGKQPEEPEKETFEPTPMGLIL